MNNVLRRSIFNVRCSMFGAALLLASTCAISSQSLHADEPFSGINLRARTFGGGQFWADELVFHGWRIQCNVWTDHYRLLDDGDVRHAWGSREACAAKLDEIRRDRELPPVKGKAVILLHGLGRTRNFMQPVAEHLQTVGGYTIVNVDYPSTRANLATHAAGLAKVIENLPDVEEINFVAHSLGNLVIRQYLADATADGKKLDPRIKRFVMLGPPNQGAAMARMFKNSALFHWVIRGTGKDLSTNFDEISKTWGMPPCEFAILAGGKGDNSGYNPLIAGDDDLLVRVEETKLAGAADYRQLLLRHKNLARDEQALGMTLSFLQDGHFSSPDERQPIGK